MTKEIKDPTVFVTPPVRIAFPSLFEARPVSAADDAEKKFQAVAIIPEGEDLKVFKAAIKAAIAAKWGAKPPKIKREKMPLHPCEDKDLAGYEDGGFYINLKSKYPPGVVDQNRQQVTDPSVIFSGCWVRFSLNTYGWDNKFGKGVSFGFDAVQLVREGERFDGRTSFDAMSTFDDSIEVEGDDGDDDVDPFDEFS